MKNIICIHWKKDIDLSIIKNVLDDVELEWLWVMPTREYEIEEEKRKEIALHNFNMFGTKNENEMISLNFISRIYIPSENEITVEKYYELLDHLEDENFIGLEIISDNELIQSIAEKANRYFENEK
jgi:hypothetical protein